MVIKKLKRVLPIPKKNNVNSKNVLTVLFTFSKLIKPGTRTF